MEYGLGQLAPYYNAIRENVLILVLMEYGLGHVIEYPKNVVEFMS